MNEAPSLIAWNRWGPALVDCLRGYDRHQLATDVVAGITLGLVALALAMAFGIASGVTPQAGIYPAIVGGFLVSALGGSRIQIGGPTGAFVVIVAGIIAQRGLSGLGRTLLLCGARHQPARFLDQAEFVAHVGAENILPHVQAALQRATAIWGERFARELLARDLKRAAV